MNISILGCGWLGLPMAKKLIENGFSVNGSTTQDSKFESLSTHKINPFLINISHKTTLTDPKNSKFWESSIIIISIPPRIRKSPIEEHVNDLENLVIHLKNLPHNPWIFYTSTTGVYENSTDKWITENNNNLVETYSKIENTIKSHPKNIIFRLAGLVNSERLIITNLSNKEITVQENEVINLIHQDDVIHTILSFIKNGNFIENEIYNICSNTHPLKTQFYTDMCLLFEIPKPIFHITPNTNGKKQISNSKIVDFLKLTFNYPDLEIFYRETFIKNQNLN